MSDTPPSADAPVGLFRQIGDALRGTERDDTAGPIGTALLLMAVPMVLEMAMESVFVVLDVDWVSSLGAPVALWAIERTAPRRALRETRTATSTSQRAPSGWTASPKPTRTSASSLPGARLRGAARRRGSRPEGPSPPGQPGGPGLAPIPYTADGE